MTKKLLILGAGTGGTIMANHFARRLDRSEWSVTVIDRDNAHYYQPGFLFIPFGFITREKITKKRSDFLPRGVEFIISEVERIDPSGSAVILADGRKIAYDFLIIATGAKIVPSKTPGMLDGWRDSIFDFYTADGAVALAEKLKSFKGGTVAVHITETPIKCPVAPLEFAFFADYCMGRKKMRDRAEIVFVTPLSAAFTKPVAAEKLGLLLEERSIRTVTEFAVERVDAAARKLISYDNREVFFDLLVTVSVNMGDELIERSGMGDELRSSRRTLIRSGPRPTRTSSGRSRKSPRPRTSTAIPTASSRREAARPSSSTSITMSNRCPVASPSPSSAPCLSSSRAA
jgi:sulfide:quinone oxidoreductase